MFSFFTKRFQIYPDYKLWFAIKIKTWGHFLETQYLIYSSSGHALKKTSCCSDDNVIYVFERS